MRRIATGAIYASADAPARRVGHVIKTAPRQRPRERLRRARLYGVGEIDRHHPAKRSAPGDRLCEWTAAQTRRIASLRPGEKSAQRFRRHDDYARRRGLALGIVVARWRPTAVSGPVRNTRAGHRQRNRKSIWRSSAWPSADKGVARYAGSLASARCAGPPAGAISATSRRAYRGIDYLLHRLAGARALGLNVIESCLPAPRCWRVDAPPFTGNHARRRRGFSLHRSRDDRGPAFRADPARPAIARDDRSRTWRAAPAHLNSFPSRALPIASTRAMREERFPEQVDRDRPRLGTSASLDRSFCARVRQCQPGARGTIPRDDRARSSLVPLRDPE